MTKKIIYLTLIVLCLGLLTPKSLQEQHTMQTLDTQHIEKEYLCLVEVQFHEARGEPLEGIKAVLSVVHNRKNTKGYPSTYCGVVQQSKQFSYRNNTPKGKSVKTSVKALERKIYTQMQQLAFEAAVGQFKPNLDPSVVFYHNKTVKNNLKWNEKSKLVTVIGSHYFYRY